MVSENMDSSGNSLREEKQHSEPTLRKIHVTENDEMLVSMMNDRLNTKGNFWQEFIGGKVNTIIKHNYPLLLNCSHLFILGASIPTIPTVACGDFWGNYKLSKGAKLSCNLDDDCIAVVDEGCDGHGPFKLCRKQQTTEGFEQSRCNESLIDIKGNERVSSNMLHSDSIYIYVCMH